jgi:hypothetical protein
MGWHVARAGGRKGGDVKEDKLVEVLGLDGRILKLKFKNYT